VGTTASGRRRSGHVGTIWCRVGRKLPWGGNEFVLVGSERGPTGGALGRWRSSTTSDRKEGTANDRSVRPAIRSSSSGWGLHLLSWVGSSPSLRPEVAQPSPQLGSVRLTGADPSSVLGLAHSPFAPALGSASTERDRHASSRTLATCEPALRRSPAVSELASHEVPGCGHASAPFRSRLGPTSACSPA
jgi:hypothetical protein